MDVFRVHAEVLPDDLAQTGGVKQGAGSQHMALRQARGFQDRVGDDVDRIADDDVNRVRRVFYGLRHDALNDVDVSLGKIDPRLAGFARAAERDDDDIGTFDVGIIAGVNVDRRADGRALDDVHRLARRLVFIDIHQNNFGGKSLQGDGVGDRRPDISGTKDADLVCFSHTVKNFLL